MKINSIVWVVIKPGTSKVAAFTEVVQEQVGEKVGKRHPYCKTA
jgi:hypothetical protein